MREIDLPSFESIDIDLLTPTAQLNDSEIPTVSEIKMHFPELGRNFIGPDDDGDDQFIDNKWVIAKQEATVNKTILSRTFAELEFDSTAFDFDFVTGGDVDEFGTEDYWRVLHRFTEIEYFSDNGAEAQDFRVWEESRHIWQQEILYRHENIGNLRWDRERILVPPLTTPPPMGSPMGTPPTYACPTTPPDDPPVGETGESIIFTEVDPSVMPEGIICYRWESLPLDWEIIFDVGQALGGFVDTDGTVTESHLISYDDAMPTPNIIAEDPLNTFPGTEAAPIKFARRYLRLRFDMQTTEPTYVELHRYGKDNYRIFLSYERDTDPETSVHPVSALTDLATGTYPGAREELVKYRPPNKLNDFPNNFWTDTDINPLNDFDDRAGSSGGFTEG